MRGLMFAAALFATAATAQNFDPVDPNRLNQRVGKLEGEIKAVQRKVFPGGDPKYFAPEIAPAAPAAVEPAGTPATSAVTDLQTRVGGLEQQLRSLTGQVEASQFRIKQLEETLAKTRGDLEFRLTALEGGAKPADVAPAAARPLKPVPEAAKPVTAPDARLDPNLDPAEAAWRVAYAPVEAKDYAKAEVALTDYIAANPKAARASSAQYWLGRSYMAQGKSAQAAKAFLDGYQKYPKGVRGPDSLLYLGNALIELKKPDQACRALNELASVYGTKLTPALSDAAVKARAAAKCA